MGYFFPLGVEGDLEEETVPKSHSTCFFFSFKYFVKQIDSGFKAKNKITESEEGFLMIKCFIHQK